MDKQKLSAIIMVPVVAIALFLAWRSYSSTLAPPTRPTDTRSGSGGGPGGGGAPGGGGPTPAQMMDAMAKELSLSADQKAKIQVIQDDLAAKRKALPKDMPRETRRAQMTANRTAADAQIKALLSPDQQKKYDAMQEKRRAQMQAMRQQGGGAPGGGRMGGSGGGPMGGGSGGGPMRGGAMAGSGGRSGGPVSAPNAAAPSTSP